MESAADTSGPAAPGEDGKEAPPTAMGSAVDEEIVVPPPCPSEQPSTSAAKDTSGGDNPSPPSALPAAPPPTPAQRDWHAEMLCGLFLRSSKQELERLEGAEMISDETTGDAKPPATDTADVSERGGGQDGSKSGESRQQPIGNGAKVSRLQRSALVDLLQLGKTMDSTVLSLIPEVLRGVTSTSSEREQKLPKETENTEPDTAGDADGAGVRTRGKRQGTPSPSDGSDFENPLLIPSSWRREDYASRTLPELEEHIIELGREGIRKNGTNGSRASHPDSDRGPQTYELFSLVYNECSLAAMANWAMLDLPQIASTDSKGNAQWEKCKGEQERRRASDTAQHEAVIPAPMFHLCGVCGGFGHYEVECEVLQERDGNQGGTGANVGDDLNRTRKINGDGAVQVELDEKGKDRIISTLASEIHAQRRQKQLHQMHRSNKRRRRGNATITDGKPDALRENRSQHEDTQMQPEDAQMGFACKICRSGLDEEGMLVCDGCDGLFHCLCLDPPLDTIPEGDWFCANCDSHDSDVSSTVEIEGCGEFVIEQRKQSVAEEERQTSAISVGQSQSLWNTALSVLPEQQPTVEDEPYLQHHLGREQADDFFIGELCWAKRYDDRLGHHDWWPGMVSESETRVLKSACKITYKVTFFALDEEAEIHEPEILPFLPFYEDLGHNRFLRYDDSTDAQFRRALTFSVSTLGLKSLGQALILARSGVQMVAAMSREHRKLLPAGWRVPVGWESAEVDTVDDIIIMAKGDIGGEGASLAKTSEEGPVSKDEKSDNAGKETASDGDDDNGPVQEPLAHRMVAQFCLDEVVGGIVSWQPDASQRSGDLDVCYAVVVSIDADNETALVRAIPMLSGKHNCLIHNTEANELLIQACNLGSSSWMPLQNVRFVSGKPGQRDLTKFRRKLRANMSREMEAHSSQLKREAVFREKFSVELEVADGAEERLAERREEGNKIGKKKKRATEWLVFEANDNGDGPGGEAIMWYEELKCALNEPVFRNGVGSSWKGVMISEASNAAGAEDGFLWKDVLWLQKCKTEAEKVVAIGAGAGTLKEPSDRFVEMRDNGLIS
ncbi:hypothetical protein ACHAXT_008896 [Thalassiosira profunda]